MASRPFEMRSRTGTRIFLTGPSSGPLRELGGGRAGAVHFASSHPVVPIMRAGSGLMMSYAVIKVMAQGKTRNRPQGPKSFWSSHLRKLFRFGIRVAVRKREFSATYVTVSGERRFQE